VNRKMLLTLAANCQSFREKNLVPPAQLLPAHRVTQTVLWSMWCWLQWGVPLPSRHLPRSNSI